MNYDAQYLNNIMTDKIKKQQFGYSNNIPNFGQKATPLFKIQNSDMVVNSSYNPGANGKINKKRKLCQLDKSSSDEID